MPYKYEHQVHNRSPPDWKKVRFKDVKCCFFKGGGGGGKRERETRKVIIKQTRERERESLQVKKEKKKCLELFCVFCEARLALNVPAEGPINHSADRARAISPLIGHSRHEGSRLARAAAHSLTHVVQVKEWRQGPTWGGAEWGWGR